MHAALGDRSLFPGLEARVYLAHAAVSPLSSPVVAAVRADLERAAALGLGALPDQVEAADRARAAFAALIGAEPLEVARMSSTSAGVTAVATGLRLAPDDVLVVFEGEFPTNVTPWLAAARRAGARVVRCPLEPFHRSHAEGLAALDALLPDAVRLIAVSAVEFQTGLAMPLGALAERAHARGGRLFVDAIQAAGAVPIDVRASGVDYLASGGHKWLMGPLGTAYLYAAPEARAELDLVQIGWMSHEEPFVYLSEPDQLRYDRPLFADSRAFEQGVLPFAGVAGSAAALGLLLELGTVAIHAHLQAWHDAFEPGAVELGWRSRRSADAAGRSGILSLAPPEGVEVAAVVEELGKRGVAITGPDGCLRVAPHWPNALSEVPFALEALERATAAARRADPTAAET